MNRLFNSVISQTLALQYTLQLGMAGYDDGPHDTKCNISEKLDALKTLQNAWINLHPRVSSTSFPFPPLGDWNDGYWTDFGGVFIRHSQRADIVPNITFHSRFDLFILHDAVGDFPPPVKTLLFEGICQDSLVDHMMRLVVLLRADDRLSVHLLKSSHN